MNKSRSILLCFFIFISWATASNPDPNTLPTCAVTCMAESLQNTTCSLTDNACLCQDQVYNGVVTNCVLGTCTVKEALVTQNLTSVDCGVHFENRGEMVIVLGYIFTCLAGVSVLMRLITRWLVLRSLIPGDYVIVVNWLINVGMMVIGVYLKKNGLGQDIFRSRPDQITNFLRAFYIEEIFYNISLTLSKITILLFYLRIFPNVIFRRWVYGTALLSVLYGIAFFVLNICQCIPVSYFWTSWDGEHKGHCVALSPTTWANSAINIALDAWILAIPMTQLIHLNLHWKKKAGVILMFAVGILITIISTVRLRSLVLFSDTSNFTMDYTELSYWSIIEVNIGVICACLPDIRLFIVHIRPGMFDSTHRTTTTGIRYNQYGGRSTHRSNAHITTVTSGKVRLDEPTGLSKAAKGIMRKKSQEDQKGPIGIVYENTYTVEYSSNKDQDDSSIVQLVELNSSSGRD